MFNAGSPFQDMDGPFKKTLLANPITGRNGGFEYGDKIILPDDVLQSLLARDIAYPMLFKLQTLDRKSIYCGVSEFTAESGQVYLPQWMMTQLGLKRGNSVDLYNVMLQKGQYLLLRPHTYRFVKRFEDPKTIFEQHINKYATLTKGTTIQISAGGEVWYFDIMDLKPARAVCIIDTDLKMDFDEPRDIKEYEAILQQEIEERKIRDKFAVAANEYHTAQLLTPISASPSVQPNGSPYFAQSPRYSGSTTPFIEPPQSSAFDGASIFAQASDDEDTPIPLDQKFGHGSCLKKGVVVHKALPSASPISSRSSTPLSTNTLNRNIVFGGPAASSSSSATPTTDLSSLSEEEKKRERDRLVRLQRAALFTKRGPATTTTTTTSAAPSAKFSQAEQDLLGLNQTLQQAMPTLEEVMQDADTKDDDDDTAEITTEQQGDWIFYRNAQGKLLRKELASKTFAMSGVGNSLKK